MNVTSFSESPPSKSVSTSVGFKHAKKNYASHPTITLYHNLVTHLALIFDDILSWKQHIQYLKQICLKKLNLMKKLSQPFFGGDRRTLLEIYRTVIYDHRCFMECLFMVQQNFRILTTLDCVHHTAIRIALGAFRTSPVISILCEVNERSLVESIWYSSSLLILNAKTVFSSHPKLNQCRTVLKNSSNSIETAYWIPCVIKCLFVTTCNFSKYPHQCSTNKM